MKVILLIIITSLICACVHSPKSKVDKKYVAEGNKHIFLQINSDPDLVAFDVRELLEDHGYQVDDSTSESHKSQIKLTEDTLTEYKRVTDSHAKYSLLISYYQGGYPNKSVWRARLIDRKLKKTIGKYTYDWNSANALNFMMSNDDIIEDMYNELIKPILGSLN